jgi:periplasmic divalent cation tolerance protein
MSKVHVLFSTVDSRNAAEQIATTVVSERLAACVNILSSVSSIYRWKKEIQQEQEFLLILKTSTDRLQDLVDRVKTLHPYEVPEILSLPVEKGYPPYLSWVLAETEET